MLVMALLTRWFWKVLYFPLTRMVIAIIAILASVVLESMILERIGNVFGFWGQPWYTVLRGAIVIITVCLVYCGYVRLLEHRPTLELCRKRALGEFAVGAAIGFGLITATIACLWLGGYYRVEGLGYLPSAGTLMGIGLVAAFVEEILMRGIIFRITEESLGTWLATVISALLFGLLHLLNPGATWIAALCVAVEAGGLLAMAYVTTRRLWLPIGLHFAWNFTQGGIFGVAVSGGATSGMLKSTLTGPDLLSGGAFGAEASIFAVLICTSMAIFLMVLAVRNGHIIQPFWSRSKNEPMPEIAIEPIGEIAASP
jgi:membrane protease YdiL (CAAX protease family)